MKKLLCVILAAVTVIPFSVSAEMAGPPIYSVPVTCFARFAPETDAASLDDVTVERDNKEVTGIVVTGDTVLKGQAKYIAVVSGDVNSDGAINSTDFTQVRQAYLGLYALKNSAAKAADVDGNGTVNSTDFTQIRRHFLDLYDMSKEDEVVFDAHPQEEWYAILDSVNEFKDEVWASSNSYEWDIWDDLWRECAKNLKDSEPDITDIYTYLAAIPENNNNYLGVSGTHGSLISLKSTTHKEFIDRVAELHAKLELRELTREEYAQLYVPYVDGEALEDYTYGYSSFSTDFGGSDGLSGMYFTVIDDNANMLDCTVICNLADMYFEITNLEEIKDEFFEIFAILNI